MVTQTQVLFLDAQREQPVLAEILPVCKPFQVGSGFAEELAFHLLKLTGTEGKVAGSDLNTRSSVRLTNLADAERQLAAGGALNVGKVDKDALCRFGTEVAGAGRILGNADKGLEHQVEFADGGKVMLAADRAGQCRYVQR